MRKRIFITIPSFAVHGGIRIILEWANRLTNQHDVFLRPLSGGRCSWFPLSPRVEVVMTDAALHSSDLLLVTSPHSIRYARRKDTPKRVVLFLQMMEHFFRPADKLWQKQCEEFYQSRHPLILISQWNRDMLETYFGRQGPMDIVGNGVNLKHFPIDTTPKDGRTVLVEGWQPGNPTKDVNRIGQEVARQLKADGCRIVAYGTPHNPESPDLLDEYVCRPDLVTMNRLYREATILVKASKMDARACAPVEAMTKGTVTARAIDQGDDDLIDNVNCLRCSYEAGPLLADARRLLEDVELRERLALGCFEHVQAFGWDYWMPKIIDLLWRR